MRKVASWLPISRNFWLEGNITVFFTSNSLCMDYLTICILVTNNFLAFLWFRNLIVRDVNRFIWCLRIYRHCWHNLLTRYIARNSCRLITSPLRSALRKPFSVFNFTCYFIKDRCPGKCNFLWNQLFFTAWIFNIDRPRWGNC